MQERKRQQEEVVEALRFVVARVRHQREKEKEILQRASAELLRLCAPAER